jgi:hypothetical protein
MNEPDANRKRRPWRWAAAVTATAVAGAMVAILAAGGGTGWAILVATVDNSPVTPGARPLLPQSMGELGARRPQGLARFLSFPLQSWRWCALLGLQQRAAWRVPDDDWNDVAKKLVRLADRDANVSIQDRALDVLLMAPVPLADARELVEIANERGTRAGPESKWNLIRKRMRELHPQMQAKTE